MSNILKEMIETSRQIEVYATFENSSWGSKHFHGYVQEVDDVYLRLQYYRPVGDTVNYVIPLKYIDYIVF